MTAEDLYERSLLVKDINSSSGLKTVAEQDGGPELTSEYALPI